MAVRSKQEVDALARHMIVEAWRVYASDPESTLVIEAFVRWMENHHAEVVRDLGAANLVELADTLATKDLAHSAAS